MENEYFSKLAARVILMGLGITNFLILHLRKIQSLVSPPASKLGHDKYPEKYFINHIKPLLHEFMKSKPDIDIRKAVQKWMLLFSNKSWGGS